MEEKHRIYDEKEDINGSNTKAFYDMRAKNISNMDCEYTSVLLGDQNPEHAEKWNIYEKENILPKLNITKDSNVLDIGCGIGRWAESIIPVCNYYCGVDFSSEMVKIAQKRNADKKGNFDFLNYSFQELIKEKKDEFKGKFNRLIIAGVCMYINDGELGGCIEELVKFFTDDAIFYMTETVGVKQRLTLKEFYSNALNCNYDAIYRTPEEYIEYFKPIDEKGYVPCERGFLPKLNNESEYSETDRWYTIYKGQVK